MSTIKVAVEGNPLFVWTGDSDDLKNSEADLRSRFQQAIDAAKVSGATVDDLIHSTVKYIAESGRFTTDNPELEMRAVVSFILAQPSTHSQHPGRFRDYISVWDFSFDIKPTPDGGFEIETLGSFELGLVQ
jgi:hypothetical protein